MYAHRIKVLHITYRDGGIVAVAHYLIFNFFIAFDTFFNQHLMNRRKGQRVLHQRHQFGLVICKAAAGTAQREGRAQHHRVTDLLRHRDTFFNSIGNIRGQYRLTQFLTQFLKEFSVLRLLNTAAFGAQQLHPTFLQHTLFFQLHSQIKAGLAANAGQNSVRSLIANDFGDIFQRQRLHIHFVRDGGISHNGGRVRVAQYHLIAILLQRQTSLRTGIIKLGRLPNDDGARTDNQYLFDVLSLRHYAFPPP